MSPINTELKIIKNKVELLKLSEMLGSVSRSACVFVHNLCGGRLLRDSTFGLGRTIGFAVTRTLLARTFASLGRFCTLLLARLQIERVALDVLYNVLVHDLSLKSLECALQALAFMKLNFCQRNSPLFVIQFDIQA